ncbi:MAG: hypothetical protein WD872_15070, partial [Pirellulaceae bacterium]
HSRDQWSREVRGQMHSRDQWSREVSGQHGVEMMNNPPTPSPQPRAPSPLPRAFVFTLVLATLTGCHWGELRHNTDHLQVDPPFPVGQVTDAFWETQQTNAEAADFVFYDHEFRGNTAELAPGAKKHLEQVALRLAHVPFPVVVEQSPHNGRPELDQARREQIVEQLARIGVENVSERVVVANAFAEGITAQEAEDAYYGGVLTGGFGGGVGRRYGGYGGTYR